MSFLNLTAKEINDSLPGKLDLQNVTGNRERSGDFWLDGKFLFKVKMPNIHGGSGAVSPMLLKACRETVLLNARNYFNLVKCPLSGEEYGLIIRHKMAQGGLRHSR